MINMKISGMLETIGAFKTLQSYGKFKAKLAMKKAVNVVYKEARKQVPVDTGALKRSIKKMVREMVNDQIEGRVSAGDDVAYYAAYVEFPTSQEAYPTNPFMERALKRSLPKVKKILKSGFADIQKFRSN